MNAIQNPLCEVDLLVIVKERGRCQEHIICSIDVPRAFRSQLASTRTLAPISFPPQNGNHKTESTKRNPRKKRLIDKKFQR